MSCDVRLLLLRSWLLGSWLLHGLLRRRLRSGLRSRLRLRSSLLHDRLSGRLLRRSFFSNSHFIRPHKNARVARNHHFTNYETKRKPNSRIASLATLFFFQEQLKNTYRNDRRRRARCHRRASRVEMKVAMRDPHAESNLKIAEMIRRRRRAAIRASRG